MLQKNFTKKSLSALTVMSAMAFSSVSSAALVDGGFESPDASGGDVGGCAGNAWDCFNSNFITSNLINDPNNGIFNNPGAYEGTQMLKQFGSDAGYLQSISVNGGDEVTGSVFATGWTGNPWANLELLQIVFFDANNNPLGKHETFGATDGSQAFLITNSTGEFASDWTEMSLTATADADAVRAQMLLLHIDLGGGGAIFLDDASLEVSAVPVPAAVWLFGSGLLGLVGVARRRKS